MVLTKTRMKRRRLFCDRIWVETITQPCPPVVVVIVVVVVVVVVFVFCFCVFVTGYGLKRLLSLALPRQFSRSPDGL